MSAVLPRAVELAGSADLTTALDELRSAPSFAVQAAYATATRQRREPGMAAAAELLEVVLLVRRRGALRGARWYHRPELVVPIMVTVYVVQFVLRASQYGWQAAVIVGVLALAIVAAVAAALRRAHAAGGNRPVPSAGAHSRIDLARLSDATTAVVRCAEDQDPSVDELVATAEHHARGIGAPLIAIAALARGEKLLIASVVPAHRRAAGTMASARQQLLERERARGVNLFDLAR